MKKREFILFSIILLVVPLVYSANYYVQNDISNGGNYTSLEGCLLRINSTDSGCIINQSNVVYTFNKTYSGGFYHNETVGNIIVYINDNVQNVIIDFNSSNFTSGDKIAGAWFLHMNETVNNITIRNFSISGFKDGVLTNGNNVTVENINIFDSDIVGLVLCYPYTFTSNNIARNINVYSSTGSSIYGGVSILNCKNAFLQNINSTGNIGYQLMTGNYGYGNITIRDSFFYDDSAGSNCVLIRDSNVNFINNSIKNCNTDNKIGVWTVINVTNLTFENNTLSNNALNMYIANTNDSIFKGNTFGATDDTNWGGVGFGGSIGFVSDYNNNIVINNTFRDQVDTGITLTLSALDKSASNTSITQNRFYNTTNGNHLKDIYVLDLGAGSPNNITVWLNHFYGPNGTFFDDALNTDFCVGGEGNFYNESLPRQWDYINETDCGPLNITQPDGLNNIINNSFTIQWKKQSSINTINYSLYYKSDNTSIWNFLASTLATSYNWTTTSINSSNDYRIKIIPNDGIRNGTNDNSTNTFTIDNTNPAITLSPTVDTSMDLGATKTITCTGTDSLGMSSTSLTVGGSSSGITCGASSCTGSYRMVTSDSKTVSCTITDKSGRTNSKSIVLSLFGQGGGSSGGGSSGGGSSSTEVSSIPITNDKTTTEQGVGQSFSISVDGNNYEAEITEVNVISVKANIAGKDLELVIGESKELDLNDDGTNDVIVTLDGIKDGNAELSIKLKEKITQEKPAQVTQQKVNTFYESINNLFKSINSFFVNIFNYFVNLF